MVYSMKVTEQQMVKDTSSINLLNSFIIHYYSSDINYDSSNHFCNQNLINSHQNLWEENTLERKL